MYLMFSHLQKPWQVVITYTLRQRAQDVILLFPLLALIICVTLGQMTSQFHVLSLCPPFNSSVCLYHELSATRTVFLYNNQI